MCYWAKNNHKTTTTTTNKKNSNKNNNNNKSNNKNNNTTTLLHLFPLIQLHLLILLLLLLSLLRPLLLQCLGAKNTNMPQLKELLSTAPTKGGCSRKFSPISRFTGKQSIIWPCPRKFSKKRIFFQKKKKHLRKFTVCPFEPQE